jgi:NSS family neurotransmitter:Na+ symporter
VSDVEQSRATWSSRPAFLLATIGGAVGLGNLWRFPYIAGDNGGSGFVLLYLGFVLILGLPLMAGEFLLGRRGKGSAVQTMSRLIRSEEAGPVWNLIGFLSLLVPFLGLSYYAVVAGWSLDYFGRSLLGTFDNFDAAASQTTFGDRIGRRVTQAALHGTFIALTVWVIAMGVNDGIERMSRILMPALFAMILVLVAYGVAQADFAAAAEFLFRPDFSKITGQSVLIALGQAFFSLAIGTGVLITYSAYMPADFPIRSSAAAICFGDTLAALLAGLAIFPIVFASGLDPGEGPGLIFVTLPIAFGNMPGGNIIGPLFFMLLIFAAYTSALGMLEPVVAWLEEKWPGRRKRLAVIAGTAMWMLGLGSVFSFNIWSGVHPLAFLGIEKTFFELTDFSVANLLIPANALLIALFAGWVLRASVVREEFRSDSAIWISFWRVSIRYVAPVAIAIILIDLVVAA